MIELNQYLQNMTLKSNIANSIADFYAFSGYQIGHEQIKEMTELIIEQWPTIDEDKFKMFIKNAKSGYCGMIYSSPVSLMVALKKFKDSCEPVQVMP